MAQSGQEIAFVFKKGEFLGSYSVLGRTEGMAVLVGELPVWANDAVDIVFQGSEPIPVEFTSLPVDRMYRATGQTRTIVLFDASFVHALGPPHLSTEQGE